MATTEILRPIRSSVCLVCLRGFGGSQKLQARKMLHLANVESGGLDFAVKLKRGWKFGYNFDSMYFPRDWSPRSRSSFCQLSGCMETLRVTAVRPLAFLFLLPVLRPAPLRGPPWVFRPSLIQFGHHIYRLHSFHTGRICISWEGVARGSNVSVVHHIKTPPPRLRRKCQFPTPSPGIRSRGGSVPAVRSTGKCAPRWFHRLHR